MRTIEAQVRSIAGRSEREPRLEVAFGTESTPFLPAEHGGGIHVDLQGIRYRATVGLVPGTPPYFRGTLSGPEGKTRWTDVLRPLGVTGRARLTFTVVVPRSELRLESVDGAGPQPEGRPVARRSSATTSALPSPPGRLNELTPEDVAHWAERYCELCSARERGAEIEIERRMPEARRRGVLEQDLFLRIGLWKTPRQRKNLLSNTSDEIARATRAAFELPARRAIKALKELHGVALRMAVAMLHWMRPAEFPMLDFRVVESMGWLQPRDYEDLDFYERFSGEVQAHARRLGVDLRTLDRALWAMSKAGGRA
jgi:hypothetical protein